MILASLAAYYEQLLRDHPDEVARPGWSTCQVKYRLVISEEGELVGVIPAQEKRGWTMRVPEQEKRTVGIRANFLCDTSSYFLGVDAKGKPERSLQCFEAARLRHHELLDGVASDAARAVLAFFDGWDPALALDNPVLAPELDGILAGGNLVFILREQGGRLRNVIEDAAVVKAWDDSLFEDGDAAQSMTCLVTGNRRQVAVLHPSIKGVQGAQSSGASLVSFNAPAFESYGHTGEQGRNAPVSVAAAQAYGAALNYLLANRSHRLKIGDTTVVFWSEAADDANSDFFALLCGGMPANLDDDDKVVGAVLAKMFVGEPVDADGLDLSATFHVLGLAPNAARLSVRFFLTDEFGAMLGHIADHYRRSAVTHASSERAYLSPYWLLRSVENEKSKAPGVSSELSASLLRAILEGGRYPEALYANALLRIRATHDVSYGQASIIRGFLIRNRARLEDEVTESLNTGRSDVAYCLGRVFALLGQLQENANGKDTLTGRYLDSASSTPAVVFPVLLKLANAHQQKLGKKNLGLAAYFDKQLTELLGGDCVQAFPKRLSQTEQGDFMLGFYHQRAARYQKASVDDNPQDEEE